MFFLFLISKTNYGHVYSVSNIPSAISYDIYVRVFKIMRDMVSVW